MQDECGSFEIGAGVDPRQELQAILRNGGGSKLGYRLMKEALIDHVRIRPDGQMQVDEALPPMQGALTLECSTTNRSNLVPWLLAPRKRSLSQ